MSRSTTPVVTLGALAFIMSQAAACADPAPGPGIGAADVTVATSGADLDPDGYSVRVDNNPPLSVAINGAITFSALTAGDHAVTLGGVAANCVVSDNPRTVHVSVGATAQVEFVITCALITGELEVRIATTGADLDPDGYSVRVDSSPAQPVTINGTITLSALTAGDHAVALNGVAANCTVTGDSLRTVRVSAGATARVDFAIDCAQLSGDLQVTISTTGADLDPDGYTVTVDVDQPQHAAINDTLTLSTLTAGSHTLTLGGVAPNCWLGANPLSVALTPPSALARFGVVCLTLAAGSVIAFEHFFTNSYDSYYGPIGVADEAGHTLDLANGVGRPTWSPDGTRIAFEGQVSTGAYHIFVVNHDGTNRSDLTPTLSSSEPAWRPDGSKIAFVASGGVNLMNPDGSGVVQVPNTFIPGARQAYGRLAWSPDGNRIAFTCLMQGVSGICSINVDGTGFVLLTSSAGGDMDPAWSPDGMRIAFTRVGLTPGSWAVTIVLMNADGSGVTQLAYGSAPAWSPDGTRIAMNGVICDDPNDPYNCHGAIQLIRVDGSGLGLFARDGYDPAWKP